MKTGSEYNDSYAEQYLLTINYIYSQLKRDALASMFLTENEDPSPDRLVFDFGGNINGTIKGGLRSACEARNRQLVYIPIDIHPAYFNTNALKEKSPDREFYEDSKGIVADIRNTGLEASIADTVILSDSLEHITEPTTVLIESYRVLKDSGNLIIVSPALYRLDVVKKTIPETITTIQDHIEASGHINFFDFDSLDNLLTQDGFTIETIAGLGYGTAFLYLLWTNPAYIVSKYGTVLTKDVLLSLTPEGSAFIEIRQMLDTLPLSVHEVIDTKLNDRKQGIEFIKRFILNDSIHPLEIIYEVLTLHPDFLIYDSNVRKVYFDIQEIIQHHKKDFDPNKLRTLMSHILNTNPHYFFANSVIINARRFSI